jgi:hypothetical protein
VAVVALPPLAGGARGQTIQVDVTASHVVNTFSPVRALGAGIDRLPREATDRLYSPATVKQVLSAGWGAVSYRLNTELHVEAWHWNPDGTWSDPRGRGYFVGHATPGPRPIRHSAAYGLPHRGFTRNEGTEHEGFSRLDDGDPRSYWKSNPYLSPAYTGDEEAESRFPQWIVIDLGAPQPVDTIRIAWGAPFARKYQVQSWSGQKDGDKEADALKEPARGRWVAVPAGTVTGAAGGTATVKLTPAPVRARFVRVVMSDSSGTCDSHGDTDRRNCVGYAINEVYLGRSEPGGGLQDLVRHSPDQKQTATACSSVDPWHEATKASENDGDQSGLDLFFGSGITRGLPAMVPVAVLYGTPQDAVAEIAYLRKRGYPLSHVELGEEADGQYMTPEHYAALYLQFAAALRKLDRQLKLGGPAFASWNEDPPAWADEHGDTSWFGRFLKYLRAHQRMADFDFMSFEHYPYDVCKGQWDDLLDEPRLINQIMDAYRKDGLPPSVPMLVTEVNVAWQAGERFMDIFGGLWLADYTGAFLRAGGAGSYFFHYLPLPQEGAGCDGTSGTFAMHTTDRGFQIRQPLAQYFAARLLTREWVQPGDGAHRVFPVTSDFKDAAGRLVVTAYALQRPDGQWSLLLINKDRTRPQQVRVTFHDNEGARALSFEDPVAVTSFGANEYAWHPRGRGGQADPDGPPTSTTAPGGAQARYTLPRASITVLRGEIAAD